MVLYLKTEHTTIVVDVDKPLEFVDKIFSLDHTHTRAPNGSGLTELGPEPSGPKMRAYINFRTARPGDVR